MRFVQLCRIGLLLLLLTVVSTACGEDSKEASTPNNGVPSGANPGNFPTDVQKLTISVADGKFEHDMYEMQTGQLQLTINTRGGPYTFAVEKLVQAQQLAANSSSTIGFTVTNPGRYQMKVSESGATATLNVSAVGR